jgi:hypothetical protein
MLTAGSWLIVSLEPQDAEILGHVLEFVYQLHEELQLRVPDLAGTFVDTGQAIVHISAPGD